MSKENKVRLVLSLVIVGVFFGASVWGWRESGKFEGGETFALPPEIKAGIYNRSYTERDFRADCRRAKRVQDLRELVGENLTRVAYAVEGRDLLICLSGPEGAYQYAHPLKISTGLFREVAMSFPYDWHEVTVWSRRNERAFWIAFGIAVLFVVASLLGIWRPTGNGYQRA